MPIGRSGQSLGVCRSTDSVMLLSIELRAAVTTMTSAEITVRSEESSKSPSNHSPTCPVGASQKNVSPQSNAVTADNNNNAWMRMNTKASMMTFDT